MRFALFALLVLVSLPASADERDARRSIERALDLLEIGASELAESDDRRRVQRAIDELSAVLETNVEPRVETRRLPLDDALENPPSPSDRFTTPVVNIADFIDNTRQYRGRTLTLNLTVRSLVFAGRGESLRNLRGSSARFMGIADDGNRLDLRVDLPAGLQVPKASFADRLLVTFRCEQGDLLRGNRALAIRRPPPQVEQSASLPTLR